MNVFVAGASGAIGLPLIAELLRAGHSVTGLTQSETGAAKLRERGAQAVTANALDAASVKAALRGSKAEIVIDELTSLPKMPSDFGAYAAGDRRLRLEGGGNLHRAALESGVRRYLQQASGFFLTTESGLADESSPLALQASPGIAASARMYTQLEERVLTSSMEGIALRYGFFYGPNTWYCPEGGAADEVRRQQFPIIAGGEGKWSFVHVEDAAKVTVAALSAPPGKYVIVDDDPLPVSIWLPRFASFVGAPAPTVMSEKQVLSAAGPDAVYYQTKLCGASNRKARQQLRFVPRRLEWSGL